MMKRLWLGAAAALLVTIGGDAEARTSEVASAACAAGLPAGTRCGTISVPEDRARPRGRRIALNYAVVPGTDPAAAPTYLLAGGPGQGAVEVAPSVVAELRSVETRGDLVFIDQRGTGASNRLTCEGGFELLAAGQAERVRACAASLAGRASLAHYGTRDSVRDLEAARRALGHDRINLIAGSYGTRLAGAYMRAHPQRVRSAILRAAAGPGFNILTDGLTNAAAELDRTVGGCAADPACAADFPRLAGQLAEVRARLARAPERVRGADGAEFEVTRELFEDSLYALMLAAPSRQMIPRTVATAAESGFQPLAPILGQIRAIYATLPVGAYLSVICAEDAPTFRPDRPGAPEGMALLGPALLEACSAWPAAGVDADLHAPLRVPVPTLILSGELDPSTNAASGERLAAMLPRARHVVMPATGHVPTFPECVRPLARRLLETGALEDMAVDCSAMRLPPFARRAAASPARAAN